MKANILLFILISFVSFAQDKAFIKNNESKPAYQGTERRLALVIGNKDYPSVNKLTNPENDANDMTAALEGLGFKVIKRNNLGVNAFKKAVDDFGKELINYDVALFYYSGHGIQFNNESYLVPIDAQINADTDTEYDCLPLGRVLGKMKTANIKTSLVFLDACRNNGYSSNKSLVKQGLIIPNNPAGSIVVFATEAGKTADDNPKERNGLFTAELLKKIATPNLTLHQILSQTRKGVYDRSQQKQIPANYDMLLGDFYFVKQINRTQNYTENNIDVSISNEIIRNRKIEESEIEQGKKAYLNNEYTVAFQLLEKNKNSDFMDNNALLWLADMYYWYRGTIPDKIESIKWYKKSTEKGNANAPFYIGLIYKYGVGIEVEKNEKEAIKWFQKSNVNGESFGQNELGEMYEMGKGGLEKNLDKAIELYQKAAIQGNKGAQINLERLKNIIENKETEKSEIEQGEKAYLNKKYSLAFQLLEKNKNSDFMDNNALFWLADMYYWYKGTTADKIESVKWYLKSAEKGNANAPFYIGLIYKYGVGVEVEKNEKEAVKWFQKSDENGESFGQNELGGMYENGKGGVEKNLDKAMELYQKSARQGNEYAKENLKRLNKK